MINYNNSVGNNFTKKQQSQAILRALPKSWDIMLLNRTQREYHYNLLLSHYLELEEEKDGYQIDVNGYVAKSYQHGTSSF